MRCKLLNNLNVTRDVLGFGGRLTRLLKDSPLVNLLNTLFHHHGTNCAQTDNLELIEPARTADSVYNSDMPILSIWADSIPGRCFVPYFSYAAQSASRSVVKFWEERA